MARSDVLDDGDEAAVMSSSSSSATAARRAEEEMIPLPEGGYYVKRFLSDRKHAFTVFVRTWTSTTVALRVEPSETVGSVKEKIRRRDAERKTPGGDRQILVFDGVELDDDRTLEHYGIENGASLDQRVRRYVRRPAGATPDGSVVVH